MHPILLNFSIWNRHIEITAYSFFMVVAALIIVCLGSLISFHRGLPARKTALWFLITSCSFPVGARLLHVATNTGFYMQNPERLLSLQPAGFALYGGLILAALVGLVTGYLLKLDIWRLADSITPALGLGIGAMRIGCYMNGCCFGEQTTLPWGVAFPSGSPSATYQFANNLKIGGLGILFQSPHVLPVHPTQLYEMLAGLVGAVIALWLLRRKATNGTAFMAFLLWFTAFRWFDYYLRVPASTLSVAGWFYPVFYGVLMMTCIAVIIRRTLYSGAPHNNVPIKHPSVTETAAESKAG
ncbi:MAG: prolipoprotein diacylglyceryl transferase [Candidatus Aquicultor sp.]